MSLLGYQRSTAEMYSFQQARREQQLKTLEPDRTIGKQAATDYLDNIYEHKAECDARLATVLAFTTGIVTGGIFAFGLFRMGVL